MEFQNLTKDNNAKPKLYQESDQEGRAQRSQNILKSLRLIFRAIQAHSRRVEKETGVSSAQLWMLWEIFKTPGLKVTELAEVLSIHQSTCSNILDKLQQKDLIAKDRSGSDQRVVRLYATDEGTRLLAEAPRPAQGAISEVLQRLPDEILRDLEVSLGRLVASLHIPEEDADLKPLDL